MLEILKYSTSGFWCFIGCYSIITTVLYFGLNTFMRIVVRFLRAINIALRGWPPEHLDADGDFKPTKTEED